MTDDAKKRDLSREYLEEALLQAKKLLTPWQYAVIRNASRAKAGGLIANKVHEPNIIEKIAIENIYESVSVLSDDELKLALFRINQWYSSAKRRNQQYNYFVTAGFYVDNEIKARSIESSELEIHEDIEILRGGCEDAGMEVLKEQPTASDVHVPTADWDYKKKKKKPKKEAIEKKALPSEGPQNADYMFVIDSPTNSDLDHGRLMSGDIGEAFDSIFLPPLNVLRESISIVAAVPIPLMKVSGSTRSPILKEINDWRIRLYEEIDRINPKIIIAVGGKARSALDGKEDLVVPSPQLVEAYGKKTQILKELSKLVLLIEERKNIKRMGGEIIKQQPSIDNTDEDSVINKLNKEPQENQDLTEQDNGTEKINVEKDSAIEKLDVIITKAEDVKRIVYGVVLDPYQVDSHGDWIPPWEIEKTAHNWMKNSRVISLNHAGPSYSKVVESFIVEYPSKEDYQSALHGENHSAFARKFGNDIVHSGAWIVATELSESDWKLFKSKKLNSYSIEGFGSKTKVPQSDMPKVKFIKQL